MDPAKLKVVELRAELAARGLDTKGVKAVLVDRLKQAIEEETGQEVPDTSILETSTEENSYSEDKVDNSELDKENSESEQNTPEFPEESQDQPFEEQIQESEEPFQAEESQDRYQESEQDDSQKEREPSPEPERESTPEPSQGEYGEQENTFESENYGSEAYQSENYQPAPAPEEVSDSREEQKLEESDKSEDMEMENVTIKQESFPDDYKQQNYEEKPKNDQYQVYDSENAQDNDKKEHYEEEVKLEGGIEVKEERDDRQEDRKRKRSRSPQPQQKQGWGQRPDWGRKDDEPDLDENSMVLGWYDSDLNLEVNREDFLEAGPMSAQGFGYIWAGCRATFGFNQGKICYEVKLLENHDVTHLEDEPSPHVLRVGWSTLDTDMMLGEEPKSYGYGGTGKISTNCKFSNYGTSFVAGDVITTYLDYGEQLQMSYAVNGQHLGVAFNISPSEIDNQPLFPHFLSKNIKFRVNFGLSEPQFPIEPEYTWAAHVPLDQRVAGPRRPERREDCEMLMMCGLPGCGKTTWANAYVKEHRDKFYNILGTNNLIDKMKIQGLPRKRNYHGRWDVLIDKCTKCLNKLLEMASRRRRNYILDQTNVYPSAQKRKMRNFGGFIRRAIVIVPTDEEFQRRCAKREAEEGKDIPDSAVLEMKANFRLPEEGEHFDEIRFIELNREESQPLVEQYNKEGRAAGFGQQAPFSGQGGGNKKFRPNDRPPFRGGGGFRGGRGGFGMDRKDRGPDRGPGGRGGFRSGGMDRGGRGGWGPRGGVPDRGPSRGGWRDRSPGGGFDRDMDSRPPGGGPWRNQRGGDRDRPYDRNQRGGPRGGGNFRDNDFSNRGGGFRDGGYDRDDYRGGYNNRGEDGFREGRGGGRGGRGGRGGFDRDNKGGGRGGFDRSRGGFNDRRGGGRDGGFDRNRGGDNRGPRDNKGGVGGGSGQGNQGSGGQGWGNQSYQGGWGQGYNQQGYNQGYNQQGYNQGYNQQQPNPQQGWGQQAWGNKGTGQQQGVTGAAGTTATPATTGYNTTGYAQQATGYNQAAGYQGYWGQYGYGQGWTQNADGTYSYPQGWQGYGYNYGAAMTPAAGVTPGMTAATPAATAATPATAPQAPAK